MAKCILAHYRAARRDLPWRRTRDPYAVWISEIMLQQTRVATVIPYYERWMERFPTVRDLASAPLDDVLAAWSGLGYYGRARNLHLCAQTLCAHSGGQLPDTALALRKLPGIGKYTAGAIASIVFGRCEPAVDGNVARVLARLYQLEVDIKSSAGLRRLWQLAEKLVPATAPGEFNQGLMELGATVCTPARPSCVVCPLRHLCGAKRSGRQDALPMTPPRKRARQLPMIDARALWIERRGRLLLARRRPRGLYGGLWELPQSEGERSIHELIPGPVALVDATPCIEHRQVLSHRRLRIRLFRAELRGPIRLSRSLSQSSGDSPYDTFAWHPRRALGLRGLSSATLAIIDKFQEEYEWNSTKKH